MTTFINCRECNMNVSVNIIIALLSFVEILVLFGCKPPSSIPNNSVTVNILPDDRPEWSWKAEEALLNANGISKLSRPDKNSFANIYSINKSWIVFLGRNKAINDDTLCANIQTGIAIDGMYYINRYPRAGFKCIGVGNRKYICFSIWCKHNNRSFVEYDRQNCDNMTSDIYRLIRTSVQDNGELIINVDKLKNDVMAYFTSLVEWTENDTIINAINIEIEKRQSSIDIEADYLDNEL